MHEIADNDNRFELVYKKTGHILAATGGLIGLSTISKNPSPIEITDVEINGSISAADACTGGVLGKSFFGGIIKDSLVNMTLSGRVVGGIVGASRQTRLYHCGVISKEIKGTFYTGGLIGHSNRSGSSEKGESSDNYVIANIVSTGNNATGGLVGLTTNNDTITNSFHIGNVTNVKGDSYHAIIGKTYDVINMKFKNLYHIGIKKENVVGVEGKCDYKEKAEVCRDSYQQSFENVFVYPETVIPEVKDEFITLVNHVGQFIFNSETGIPCVPKTDSATGQETCDSLLELLNTDQPNKFSLARCHLDIGDGVEKDYIIPVLTEFVPKVCTLCSALNCAH